jgi:hypothetical protein
VGRPSTGWREQEISVSWILARLHFERAPCPLDVAEQAERLAVIGIDDQRAAAGLLRLLIRDELGDK